MAAPWEKYQAPQAAGAATPGGGMIISDPTAIRELQLKEAAAARDAAALGLRMREAEGGNVPSGYRRTATGGLEAIPGGPADLAAKVKPLREGDAQKLTDDVQQLDALKRAVNTFQDDFAGNLLGDVENLAQGVTGMGTPGQRDWWADFRATDNVIRNSLFGASLTAGEKAAYQATTITPRMAPDEIRRNLERRAKLVEEATKRRVNRLRAGGYNEGEIDAIAGPVLEQPMDEGQQVEAQPATPRGVAMGAVQPGQLTMTPQDMEASKAMQAAWDASGKFEDVARVAAQYGQTFSPEKEAMIRANEGKPINFVASPTGTPTATEEAVGEFVSTPMGETIAAGAVGSANAMTLGMLDELAPVLGLDAERVQMAKRYLQERNPGASLAGEVVGSIAPTGMISRGVGGVLAGTRAAGTAPLAGDVVAGGLAGAGEANENRTGGALLGGTLGGFGGAAGRRLFGGGGAPPDAMPPGGGTPSPLANDVASAERLGIDVMTSDVFPPRTFVGRSAQFTGERIPFAGTGGARAEQAQQRQTAIQNIVQDYGAVDPSDVPKRIFDAMAGKRADEIVKYTQSKREVIDRLAGNGEVPLNATQKALGSVVADLRRRRTPAADGAADAIERIGQQLQGRNLAELEAYRQDVLANIFKDEAAFPIAVRDVGEKALRKLYDPVRQDMGDFIKEAGEPRDFTKWMVANKRLSEGAQELKNQTLKSVLRRGDATPEAVERLLFSSKPSDIQALYKALPEDGRATARLAIVNRLFKDAGGDLATISPEKFVNAAKKQAESIGVFFDNAEGAQLQGLLKALKMTQRASQSAVSPVTGAQTFLPSLFAALLGGVGSGVGAAGVTVGIGGIARAYESKAMRNLLIRMNSAPDNSPQAQQTAATILERFRDAASRAPAEPLALAATREEQ